MPQGNSARERNLDSSVTFPPNEFLDKGTWKPRPGTGGKFTVKGRQFTASEGHKRGRDGRYHEGGPFFTSRISTSLATRYVSFLHPKGLDRYSGPVMVPGVPVTKLGGMSTPSQDSTYLDSYGTTAIAIVDPTNPNASTGQALGEIYRDGLPIPGIQAWRGRTDAIRAAGSEYLNAVFGWLPLVSDIKDTAESIRQKNVILKGYRDNAGGSGVHRRFEFDEITSESETVLFGGTKLGVQVGSNTLPGGPDLPVPVTCRTTSSTKRWFSGRFTYASPDSSDTIGRMLGVDSEIDRLFGLSLTPDIVWELTPWSWAADWFSNAGDVIHNLTSFKLGGLVMRYGYIMEEVTSTATYSMPGSGYSGIPGAVPPITVTSVTKRRRPANPFGFGLSWEGLSPTQLAITAALGITRLR